jgi:hypothetical protein
VQIWYLGNSSERDERYEYLLAGLGVEFVDHHPTTPRNSRRNGAFCLEKVFLVTTLENALFSSVSYDQPPVIPVILTFRFVVSRFMAKLSETKDHDHTGHTFEGVPTAVDGGLNEGR